MLQRAVGLYRAVAAMVVGEDEALRADHLGRATAAEKGDGILQRSVVDAVDVLCGDLQPFRAHIALNGLEQCGHPHTFMSVGGEDGENGKKGEDGGACADHIDHICGCVPRYQHRWNAVVRVVFGAEFA